MTQNHYRVRRWSREKTVSYYHQVDELIAKIFKQLPKNIHKDIHYLFKGKRIRSRLMFSLGSKLGCRLPHIVLPAVGVEVIHTISLIHDDIIDQQRVRRSYPTLHNVYGNRVSVFIGSSLLQCLGGEMLRYRYHPEVVKILYSKIAELCRGEVLQDIPTGIVSLGRREYLQMIRQKTGSLFSYSFIVPSLLCGKGLSIKEVSFAEECGYLLGLCFQLADDIADLEEDMEVIYNERAVLSDGDSPERLFSYPLLLWQEIDAVGFEKYFYKPSVTRFKEVREKLEMLIYNEIIRDLHVLEAKSRNFKNNIISDIFLFLRDEVYGMFKHDEAKIKETK